MGQLLSTVNYQHSIWTYNVKMAQTEVVKGREKSKFVDDAHKDGFEVTKILTNYLQKSQKGWKEKDATAQADQGDVTKLVVKFRTIIKVTHHNLDQLDRNLLEGCLSAYPDMTEDMLEAKTVPQEQNGHMKREGSDNETKKKPKKKPAKKVAVAAADVKDETLEKDVSSKKTSKESKETKKNESDKKPRKRKKRRRRRRKKRKKKMM